MTAPRFEEPGAYRDPYQPSTSDYPASAAPAYRSPAQSDAGYTDAPTAFRPSEIYARPAAPSDVWQDDGASSIAPGDSVSQLGRQDTHRRMVGPRPLEGAGMSPVAEGDEAFEHDSPSNYQYVPPHMLEDDRSTVVGPQPQRSLSNQSATRSGSGAGPAHAIYPVAQRKYPTLDDDYAGQDDLEYNHYHQPARSGESSAQLPLVGAAAAYGAVHSAATTPVGNSRGYANVSPYDEEDLYGNYAPRSLGYDEEHAYHDKPGQLSPHAYGDDDGKDVYPPAPGDKAVHGGPGLVVDPRTLPVSAWWRRAFWGDKTPAERREWEHRNGLGIQRWPFACWALTLIMCAVMVYQLVHMHSLTGSVIQTKPSINWMIGPSGAVLINEGARFNGCIKNTPNITDIDWICPKYSNVASVTTAQASCSMSDVCGFGGWTSTEEPSQSFRFVSPKRLRSALVRAFD